MGLEEEIGNGNIHWRKWMSLLFFVKIRNPILNGFGKPWRRTSHAHTTLAACITSRKKEDKNVTFLVVQRRALTTKRILTHAFKKKKDPSLTKKPHTNKCLQPRTNCHNLDSFSSPKNFCSKQRFSMWVCGCVFVGLPWSLRGKESTSNAGNQIRSVAQSCPTLCDPMHRSTPGLPVHHQLPEFTQTHIHRVSDAIQPSHPLSSPSPLVPNPSQHQSLFQWVNSSHEEAKVLEFQL